MIAATARLTSVALLALFMVGCNLLGGGQDAQTENPRPTAEQTEAATAEETATADETQPAETDEPEQTDAGETDEPGGGGEDVSVFDLEAGDCFNVEEENPSGIESVPVVPCDEPHQYEVYAIVNHPGDEYPGDDEMDDFATTECQGDAFSSYVGAEYEESIYYSTHLPPNAETWEQGDREVVCVLYQPDEEDPDGVRTLTGSARDSGE